MKHLILPLLLLFTTVGAFAELRVTFVAPDIARVQYSASAVTPEANNTGVCVYTPEKVKVKDQTRDGKRTLTTDALVVEIDLKNDALTFRDRKTGRVLLAEDPSNPRSSEPSVIEHMIYDDASAHTVKTANGDVTVKDVLSRDTLEVSTRYFCNFLFQPQESLYGLGSHMEDYLNLRGKKMYLTQHNLKVTVPVINSTNGYGLLFDAGCAMIFSDDQKRADKPTKGSMMLEAADQVDYYFIKGDNLDRLVSRYRWLTGRQPMFPRYAFGYVQSKERYVSSDDIIKTVKRYRDIHVPLDIIVQDWSYWPEGWGYLKMDPKHYPDPKALADSVHALNAKLMVSIWPNPQACPQEKEFKEAGHMLEHSVYDAFNPEARDHYWQWVNREFFSRGFDAWWCDCSEPLDGDWNQAPEPVNGEPYGRKHHERRYHLNKDILSETLGGTRSNLYSLYHAKGIYEHQRGESKNITNPDSEKRVLNLTRSSYAGQQRYSTITWNGDVAASWETFRQQIPSGLNFMATGCPYWTIDVGAFFVKKGWRWFDQGEFPEGVKDENYRELYVRMLQWATFLPMMRSHGTDTPREIWNFGEPGTPHYDAIKSAIELRYRLLPYIYSLAGQTTLNDYTMARLLAFDFPDDTRVHDIKDQYMFGPALLVCPVVEQKASSRSVYLPKGADWIDFYSNTLYKGGQTINVTTSLDRIPLFVKAGSIIPMGEVVEYSGAQAGKPITLKVYPGADTSFDLYDDEGDNYNYEKGRYAIHHITWKNGKLKVKTKGSYSNMPSRLPYSVEIVEPRPAI